MNDSVKKVPPQKFRARHRNRLAVIFALALALSVLAQWFFVPTPHPYFVLDRYIWFYPAFGLLASMFFVVFSRFLGFILKRRDTYWEDKS